jgi:hypothetical protein
VARKPPDLEHSLSWVHRVVLAEVA